MTNQTQIELTSTPVTVTDAARSRPPLNRELFMNKQTYRFIMRPANLRLEIIGAQ
jgi:hypothetical protein